MNYRDQFKPVTFEEILEKHKKPIEEAIRKAKEEE